MLLSRHDIDRDFSPWSTTPPSLVCLARALAANAMSAPILSLPTELFESVARFACPRDLLAFRLASRAVQERTFDVFLDVHFSTYATLLSYEHSLRTLLAISSNVRFARAMKKIIFCTESMRPHMWRAYLPNLDEDKYHLRSRRRLFRKQKMLRMHNIDIELLARIFGNLIVIGNIVEVQVAAMHSDPSRPPLKPWGHHTISTLCDNPRILLDVFGDERVRTYADEMSREAEMVEFKHC